MSGFGAAGGTVLLFLFPRNEGKSKSTYSRVEEGPGERVPPTVGAVFRSGDGCWPRGWRIVRKPPLVGAEQARDLAYNGSAPYRGPRQVL